MQKTGLYKVSEGISALRAFVTDKNGTRVVKGCKTSVGDRWLYMDDGIMDMLADYREKYLHGAIKNKQWNIDEWAVFSSVRKVGEPLPPATVRSWLKSFLKKNELPKFLIFGRDCKGVSKNNRRCKK